MRRYLALLALAALAACGGGDDALSAAEAEDVAKEAQLTVDDLGEGWEKVSDEPADDSDSEDEDELADCGLDEIGDDESLAESNERTFGRAPSEVAQQQLSSTTFVVEDESEVDAAFELMADDEFAECLVGVFEKETSSSASGEGISFELGEADVTNDGVDGADHSYAIAVPFTAGQEGVIELEGAFDVRLVANGQVVSTVIAYQIGEAFEGGQLDELLELLSERQQQ